MTLRTTLLAGVFALGAIAAPVTAQDEDLDPLVTTDVEREIVVSATPDPEPEGRQVNRQARSITVASNIFDEPLALFQSAVCPGVSGLPEDLGNYIVDRIRFNTERAGLRLDEAQDCRVNLLVSFVIDGQSALNAMASNGNSLLAHIPVSEKRRLLNDDSPVHAWSVISERTRDGMPIRGRRELGMMPTINTQSANSLFLLPTRKDIEISVVVIDIPAIDGMSAVQIADYATMRGLAQTRPIEGNATYGTILNLFDEDGLHAPELTTFDLAYLNAMYANMPNIAGATKIGAVRGMMEREIAAAESAELEDYSRNE
jgi:hypothetical protein